MNSEMFTLPYDSPVVGPTADKLWKNISAMWKLNFLPGAIIKISLKKHQWKTVVLLRGKEFERIRRHSEGDTDSKESISRYDE